MKKTCLYTALLSLSFSLSSYAMGLGDLTVKSYLNQPFNAEIELIDVGNTPLSDIKAGLASVEEFQRVGLEQVYGLTSLTFSIEKNSRGKAIITIRSDERIDEPFMPLLVDLAWANGQVYRSYTILLDPPNYQPILGKKRLRNHLSRQIGESSSHQIGAIEKPVYSDVEHESDVTPLDHRGVVNYGPTGTNETVWQIAQRYKTGPVLLQQMILAIVDTNPDAFTEGNLNGLKEGSRLQIPSNSTAIKVPFELAKTEVLAHDKAWQTRRAIEHTLLPPYIEARAPITPSEQDIGASGHISIVPAVPVLSSASSEADETLSRIISLNASPLFIKKGGLASDPGDMTQDKNTKGGATHPKFNAELELVASAIDSFRQSNVLLGEQLHLLQADNKKLKQQITQREQEIQTLKVKLHLLSVVPIALAPQAAHEKKGHGWALILLLLGLGGGLAYWHFWIRFKETPPEDVGLEEATLSEVIPPIPESPEMSVASPPMNEELPPEAVVPEEPKEIPVLHDVEVAAAKSSEAAVKDDHILEFEHGLEAPTTVLPLEVIKPETTTKPIRGPKSAKIKVDENSVAVSINPVEALPLEDKVKPAKSKVALETLLDLAKTYVSMDDLEAAKQSLQEVYEHGNEEQRLEAKRMLDEIEKKH